MAVPLPPADNEGEALQAQGLEWGPQLFGLLLRAQSVVFPTTEPSPSHAAASVEWGPGSTYAEALCSSIVLRISTALKWPPSRLSEGRLKGQTESFLTCVKAY